MGFYTHCLQSPFEQRTSGPRNPGHKCTIFRLVLPSNFLFMSIGTVLIIDDEEKLRTLLARIIRLEGFTVLEAENLKQGGKLLEKGDIDVLLSDVKLPDGNG